MLFSNISTRSATASARAPPLPPSPVMTARTGTWSVVRARMFAAMADDWPRSSASMPGAAPGVSISVSTGRRSFSASRNSRSALRYPSGSAMPKLVSTSSRVEWPFWVATTMIGVPPRSTIPPTIARRVGALPVTVQLDERIGEQGDVLAAGGPLGVPGERHDVPGGPLGQLIGVNDDRDRPLVGRPG